MILHPWEVPKSLLVIFATVNIALLASERFIIFKYMEYESRKEENSKKVLVLGIGDTAKQYLFSVNDHMIKIIGLIGTEKSEEGIELFGSRVVGSIHNLGHIIHSNHVDELVVALPAKYFAPEFL